jgi:hypothetical protein
MSTTVQTYKRRGSTIWLNKREYRGFLIGNLPQRFAFIYNEDKEQEGITSWFNHKGWTFILEDDLKTGW